MEIIKYHVEFNIKSNNMLKPMMVFQYTILHISDFLFIFYK